MAGKYKIYIYCGHFNTILKYISCISYISWAFKAVRAFISDRAIGAVSSFNSAVRAVKGV